MKGSSVRKNLAKL